MKIRKTLILMIFVLIPLFSAMIFANSFINNAKIDIKTEQLKTSGVEHFSNNLWIENPTFDDLGEPWNLRIEGDTRDVIGDIGHGNANYTIIGDSRIKQIDEPLNNTLWVLYNNPDLPILPSNPAFPLLPNITENGCEVSHRWDENINQTHNRPSAQWKRTIEMPVDMRDYIITEASLEVIFNATVTVSPTVGGIERRIDEAVSDKFSTGDYAEFYVLVSDVDETFPAVRIAYNHTGDLGLDGTSGTYPDTPMDIVPENVLKSILNSVLETDGFNFTITLGIDIYCEDNLPAVDIDIWDSLIIRSFNLTFSYEKKINQFTSIGWEQEGNALTEDNIQVTDAKLNFTYKIDTLWSLTSTSNSEIRALINNNSVSEINLLLANNSFQYAEYDVTSFILKDLNITLSIQVYLADQFGLDQNITISIDDVYLIISYIKVTIDIFSEPWVFTALLVLASVLTAGAGGYLVAYQRILRYPRPVRKVMKYRRTLNKSKAPEVAIMPQDVAFKKAYNQELTESSKFLKLRPGGIKEPISKEKDALEKTTDKVMEKQIDSEELISKSLEKKEELDELVKDSTREALKTDK
ncbi:MAG: hypothetical protein JSV62_14715 [Promethearchaeota archaeon]|nr:MAG: hypothetical protein JSV62_14715 [Candidatus Lokiarchaeota archaeon]